MVCKMAQAGESDCFDFDDEELEGLQEKIDALLDCVERPTGTLNARLPQTPESERALLALFDAIGRTL